MTYRASRRPAPLNLDYAIVLNKDLVAEAGSVVMFSGDPDNNDFVVLSKEAFDRDYVIASNTEKSTLSLSACKEDALKEAQTYYPQELAAAKQELSDEKEVSEVATTDYTRAEANKLARKIFNGGSRLQSLGNLLLLFYDAKASSSKRIRRVISKADIWAATIGISTIQKAIDEKLIAQEKGSGVVTSLTLKGVMTIETLVYLYNTESRE